jgi:transaldolase
MIRVAGVTAKPARAMQPERAMDDRIRQARELGQSFWIDNLHRGMLDGGQLERWIRSGVSGVTSNPTIFERSIKKHSSYRQDIDEALRRQVDPVAIYDSLVIQDIRRAADLLRATWEERDRRDGFVSLEVSPKLADLTDETVAEGERLWSLVERPNLFIKVPATPAGVPAIARLIERGISVNVTLIFSIAQWRAVIDAYQRGLEARAARGEALDVPSVASFFVSRIDSAVERRLPRGSRLRGRIAVANARVAYQSWLAMEREPRWRALAEKGAQAQRLLWASTGTKNSEYRDVLYVEELIGPDTIDTMPDATLEAFRYHGIVRSSLIEGRDTARMDLAELLRAGIDLEQVCEQLQRDGVRTFSESYDAIMRWIAEEPRAPGPSAPPPG